MRTFINRCFSWSTANEHVEEGIQLQLQKKMQLSCNALWVKCGRVQRLIWDECGHSLGFSRFQREFTQERGNVEEGDF